MAGGLAEVIQLVMSRLFLRQLQSNERPFSRLNVNSLDFTGDDDGDRENGKCIFFSFVRHTTFTLKQA